MAARAHTATAAFHGQSEKVNKMPLKTLNQDEDYRLRELLRAARALDKANPETSNMAQARKWISEKAAGLLLSIYEEE